MRSPAARRQASKREKDPGFSLVNPRWADLHEPDEPLDHRERLSGVRIPGKRRRRAPLNASRITMEQ